MPSEEEMEKFFFGGGSDLPLEVYRMSADAPPQLKNEVPGLRALLLGQLTQGLELLGQQAALAEKAHAHRVQG